MREQIAKADPENTLWQTELASSLMQLAGAGDDPQSRLTRALSLLQKLTAPASSGRCRNHGSARSSSPGNALTATMTFAASFDQSRGGTAMACLPLALTRGNAR
jgi:hypothetical protein